MSGERGPRGPLSRKRDGPAACALSLSAARGGISGRVPHATRPACASRSCSVLYVELGLGRAYSLSRVARYSCKRDGSTADEGRAVCFTHDSSVPAPRGPPSFVYAVD